MLERTIPVADAVLNCARGPESGPPLVLFHGVTRCWRDFEAILPALTSRWSVTAMDHRGHGRSSRGGSQYRVVDFSADAVGFLEAAMTGPAVVLGHSLGALVAAAAAAARPALVRALILEDPPGTTLAGGFRQSRFHLQFTNTLRLLTDGVARADESLAGALGDMPVQRPSDGRVVPFREIRDPDALRFSAECLRQIDPAVLAPLTAGRWLAGLDWFGLLPRIQCPVLLLRADPLCGGMLSETEAARITSSIPCCHRVDLPGVGHSIHSAEPARMLGLMSDFFNTHHLMPKEIPP